MLVCVVVLCLVLPFQFCGGDDDFEDVDNTKQHQVRKQRVPFSPSKQQQNIFFVFFVCVYPRVYVCDIVHEE